MELLVCISIASMSGLLAYYYKKRNDKIGFWIWMISCFSWGAKVVTQYIIPLILQ